MLAGEEDPEEVVLCRNVRDALHEGRKAKGGRTAHACRCSHRAHPADYRLCLRSAFAHASCCPRRAHARADCAPAFGPPTSRTFCCAHHACTHGLHLRIQTAQRPLPTAQRPLPTAHRPTSTAHRLPLTAHRPTPTAHACRCSTCTAHTPPTTAFFFPVLLDRLTVVVAGFPSRGGLHTERSCAPDRPVLAPVSTLLTGVRHLPLPPHRPCPARQQHRCLPSSQRRSRQGSRE